MSTSLLLKRSPADKNRRIESSQSSSPAKANGSELAIDPVKPDLTLGKAIRTKEMMMIVMIFFSLFFCTQMLLVHLVNFATDTGISPMVAASFISLIGVVSIGGRLLTGTVADRIGTVNGLFLCCGVVFISMIYLIFVNSLWGLYIFAVVFGLAYGGEIPLIPMLINQFYGTRSMAALVGVLMFISGLGGALGPLVGGLIFDATSSYHWAFIIASIGSFTAIVLTLVFKKVTGSR
jgi:MFS family permease